MLQQPQVGLRPSGAPAPPGGGCHIRARLGAPQVPLYAQGGLPCTGPPAAKNKGHQLPPVIGGSHAANHT